MSLSRRGLLLGLPLAACASGSGNREAEEIERSLPPPEPGGAVDSVDAVASLFLPSDPHRPGAREADVDGVLGLERFLPLAIAQGFVPPLPDSFVDRVERAGTRLRAALNTTLDALASQERPLARFHELPLRAQEAIVARAFDEPAQRPAMIVLRAIVMTSYLGAVTNDVGLRAVGFPPFEDFDDRLACSGYPRKDPETGVLDTHSYDRAPALTPGDDLALVLDAAGDLR